MKINTLENGIVVVREMTSAEYTEFMAKKTKDTRTYQQRVVSRIREKYSVDDEIAIIRQRDTKPEEFLAYYEFIEKIKEEEKDL